ncbi:jg16595 [Pararge aegeria aegeria]|uniref:Jg16595 protein n=1 Tax=Pararge aegeria aegeria TaxID=348720 RepID=A0A8S4RBB7_9NEOP|nr:jg16595 [Pararge aegeria aegeria]
MLSDYIKVAAAAAGSGRAAARRPRPTAACRRGTARPRSPCAPRTRPRPRSRPSLRRPRRSLHDNRRCSADKRKEFSEIADSTSHQ